MKHEKQLIAVLCGVAATAFAGVELARIPVYDSPCLVTERAALDLM